MTERWSEPLITTIIPTYRRPRLLARAIRSVLRQTYPRYQVCVYDNASGDETPSVVAALAAQDRRVQYYRHDQNIGPLENFRFGLERVDTRYFSFLSDDDILLPQFYETTVAALEQHEAAMFAASQVVLMDQRGRMLDLRAYGWQAGLYHPPYGLLEMLGHSVIPWNGILFRRDVLRLVRTLDPKLGKHFDLDFALRIASLCPFVICPRPGAIFFMDLGARSAANRLANTWRPWLKIMNDLASEERIPLDVRARAHQILDRQLRRRLFVSGIAVGRRGNAREAYQCAGLLANRYHKYGQALLVGLVVALCKKVELARVLLAWLTALRRWRGRARWAQMQKELGQAYGSLLEM